MLYRSSGSRIYLYLNLNSYQLILMHLYLVLVKDFFKQLHSNSFDENMSMISTTFNFCLRTLNTRKSTPLALV